MIPELLRIRNTYISFNVLRVSDTFRKNA